jgi:hypothetical protein
MTALVALAALVAAAEPYAVDADAGNNNFHAVFKAPLGETINAMSSKVSCKLTYDEAAGTASGSCSVPLTSIRVDEIDVKTEHFQDWATNKKVKAKKCAFEAKLTDLAFKTEANKEVPFTGEAAFTICGRARTDGAKEKLEGTVVLFPPGSYGETQTIRVRAKVASFDREAYQIGPKWTDGWLARVQTLASVVATSGEIEVTLFAQKVGEAAKK